MQWVCILWLEQEPVLDPESSKHFVEIFISIIFQRDIGNSSDRKIHTTYVIIEQSWNFRCLKNLTVCETFCWKLK